MNASIKRNTKALFFITWAALILLLANFAQATQEVEFNYNGRVKHNGTPFDGTGYFKFALVNQNGQTTYWSNDSTSVTGSEPSGYIESQVIDGFFNVAIGDTLTGMDPLIPTVFNEDERIYLRVWFSHDIGAPFQRLNPDRRVVNPALLGQQSFDEDITLYVDAENGSDSNNGLTTDTAKATIQTAVNLLPSRINSNITIKIFPGTYMEEVELLGFIVSPQKELKIIGDESWTPESASEPNVRITGTSSISVPAIERENCISIINANKITIQGIKCDYAVRGVYISQSANIKWEACETSQCNNGVLVEASVVTLEKSYSHDNTYGGFTMQSQSRMSVIQCKGVNNAIGIQVTTGSIGGCSNCVFTDNTARGMYICSLCNVEVGGSLGPSVFSNNGESGVYVLNHSGIGLTGDFTHEFNNNGSYGIWARRYSSVETVAEYTATGNGVSSTLASQVSTIF
ncbi:right-handed parallel beta-helix repeat-containing protein [Candidatus Sumerlaeota bacterium]|nr:right-handed parallel beta-helix repeat-containing protein [Candidatus Sumerlaeota bacterium]